MRTRVFYGWYIVLAAHLLFALIFGAAYSFGAFLSHIQGHFDVGRFSVASIFSLTAFIYYTVGIVSGWVADRTSTKLVVGGGVVLLSLGFFLSSIDTGSLGLFLLSFCSLVGLGVGFVYIPTVTVVQRWFVKKRSRASGLALAGTGLGTFIGPISAGLLMQHLSWQATLQVFALALVVIGLAAAAVLKSSPAELGLMPDGEAPQDDKGALRKIPAAGMRLFDAVRTGCFWWYFLGILLGSIGLFLAVVHINPYARQYGVSADGADLLIGLIGIGNVAGRFLLGSVGDKIGSRRLLIVLTVCLAGLNVMWMFAHHFVALGVFALLFGVANGGCISLYPAVAASWFGTKNLGAILGALYISVGIAAVAGGSLGGYLYDIYDSYTTAIMFSAVSALASVIFILMAAQYLPQREVQQAQA